MESEGICFGGRLGGLCTSNCSEEEGLRILPAGDLSLSTGPSSARGGDLAVSKSLVMAGVKESYESSRSRSPVVLSESNLEYCEVSLDPGEARSVVLVLLAGGKEVRADDEVGFAEDDSGRLKPKLE